MYVLVQMYHECKTTEIEVNVAGVYDTFAEAHASLECAVAMRRGLEESCDPRWAVYGNEGYVVNELFNRWEWMVLNADKKMGGLYVVCAYEFGFDEEG